MVGALMVMGIGLGIASLSFILLLMLLKEEKVNREKLEKILGNRIVEQLKQAKSEEEIATIIRSLPTLKKSRLKTLLESQDIRDAIRAIKTHLRED